MGAHMARRLVEAGHKVIVFDVRQEAIGNIAALGAVAARSPKEVADAAETVMVSLPTPDIVLKVATGPDGVIGRQASETLCRSVDHGLGHGAACLQAACGKEHRADDAPVSGGVRGAAKGTVAVMASGPRADVEAVEPGLRVIGSFFISAKNPRRPDHEVCNNVLSAAATVATSESFVTGVKAGLDPRTMVDVINASSGRSTATEQKFPEAVIPRTFNQGFTAGLMLQGRQSVSSRKRKRSACRSGHRGRGRFAQAHVR